MSRVSPQSHLRQGGAGATVEAVVALTARSPSGRFASAQLPNRDSAKL